MPKSPKRPCRQCKTLHRNKTGYCDDHQQSNISWSKWQSKRGNRHQRGYGNMWDKLRKQILERDKALCQICIKVGHLIEATQVDHIKPKSKGGTDDNANLQSLCNRCHLRKTAAE